MFSPKTPSMPLTVVIKPTKACNLKCIHCYDNAGVRLDDELSSTEVKKVIDDLVALDVPHIHFSGGELLLKHDIFEIVRYASARDIFVS